MAVQENQRSKYYEILLEKFLFLICSAALLWLGFNLVDEWKVKRDYQQELFSRKIQCYTDVMAKLSELPQQQPEYARFFIADKTKAQKYLTELLQLIENNSIFMDKEVYGKLIWIAAHIQSAVHQQDKNAVRETMQLVSVDIAQLRTLIRRSFQMDELIIQNNRNEWTDIIPNTNAFHE